jgi:hypothetical protein
MIPSQYPALALPKSCLRSCVIRSALIFACGAQNDISNHLLCTTNCYRDIFDEGYMHPVDASVPADMPVSLSYGTCHVEELNNLQPWYHATSATTKAGPLTHKISFIRNGRNSSYRGCLWACNANAVIKTDLKSMAVVNPVICFYTEKSWDVSNCNLI